MENLKFELIIAYYKRPDIVKNALNSILKLNNNNWHLTFIDDSGNDEFRETFFNFGLPEEKITYVPIMMDDSVKINTGGSIFGKYINDAIIENDCDIVILICDDDALFPDYLDNLNTYYNENPNEVWSYSHVKYFNPEIESYEMGTIDSVDITLNGSNLNEFTIPINPYCKVDSSQVTFRKSSLINGNVWYVHPRTLNLDADIFTKMFNKYGYCKFNGYYGQYKGWFKNQLGLRHRRGEGDFL